MNFKEGQNIWRTLYQRMCRNASVVQTPPFCTINIHQFEYFQSEYGPKNDLIFDESFENSKLLQVTQQLHQIIETEKIGKLPHHQMVLQHLHQEQVQQGYHRSRHPRRWLQIMFIRVQSFRERHKHSHYNRSCLTLIPWWAL